MVPEGGGERGSHALCFQRECWSWVGGLMPSNPESSPEVSSTLALPGMCESPQARGLQTAHITHLSR